MPLKLIAALIFLAVQFLMGCGRAPAIPEKRLANSPPATPYYDEMPAASGPTWTLRYDFRDGEQAWKPDYAFYADWMKPEIAFEGGLATSPLDQGNQAYELSGANVPVTLFMYLSRELGPENGIQPGEEYDVLLRLSLLSAASRECFGFGGSPGDMTLYAGAFSEPLQKYRTDGAWSLSPDPILDERAYATMGDIHNGQPCEPSLDRYSRVSKASAEPVRVRADAEGRLHLVVGTAGGFMGETKIYIESIDVDLTAIGRNRVGRSVGQNTASNTVSGTGPNIHEP